MLSTNSNLFVLHTDNYQVDKEAILGAYPQEQYMSYYVGRPVDRRRFCSPFRADKHPSCCFYRNRHGDIMFKDFADGTCVDIFGVVMKKFNCTYSEALETIARDFGIKGTNTIRKPVQVNLLPPGTPSKINVSVRPFTKSDLQYWKQFNITKKILNKYQVYSCKGVFLNNNILTVSKDEHVFGYFGGINDNLELWRVYYPERRERRFLTNWPKSKIQGWDQLPDSGNLVVITKSMKDVMVFDSFGIPACAPNSELFFLTGEQIKSIKQRFKHIVLLWDNDRVGMSALWKLRKEHPDFICTILPKSKGSKDISDFIKDWGVQETKSLIINFIKTVFNDKKEAK